MDERDIRNRFTYHPPATTEQADEHVGVRESLLKVAEFLNVILPEGREKSLAITHLEEAMMWSNAAIARPPVLPESSFSGPPVDLT